ncbi:MAG: hypothetical protein EA406_05340 [Rhodospirillales bacterium]|nr:MAG: hypothetical protein EA406_05340 [Rhodospirillales bacterium]
MAWPGPRLASAAGVASVVLVAALLGSCVGASPPADLGSACQIRPCTCEGPPDAFWRKPTTAEVQWTERGRAYCPEGYTLKLASRPRRTR